MNDTLKKINKSAQSRRTLMILTVICAIISAIILGNWIIDQINLAINGEPDFTQLSQSEMKDGLFVTGTIEEAAGPYAEQYTKDEYGQESEASLNQFYYLVPIYAKTGDAIECFVSFEADFHLNDRNDIEEIAENTANGYETKPLVIEHGRMTSMKPDQKRILENWVTSPDSYGSGSFVDYCAEYNLMGTTDKDVILSKIITYNIEREWNAGIEFSNILYPLVPGVVFVLWIMLIDKIQKKRKAKYKQEMDRQFQQFKADEKASHF